MKKMKTIFALAIVAVLLGVYTPANSQPADSTLTTTTTTDATTTTDIATTTDAATTTNVAPVDTNDANNDDDDHGSWGLLGLLGLAGLAGLRKNKDVVVHDTNRGHTNR